MRIQHNIPAMNSYRNYTSNISSVNKSLEKLSSGYRINRAGDDAAGLAISEKMRAQISGLEQAQSNAKSGINLVQTAEGALTEVHDMLNRMYTLAEQSANGTYADEVDREQLQKEISSLRTEIDRVADSANFNGIKLLDGSLDANDKVKVNQTTFTGMTDEVNYENYSVNPGAGYQAANVTNPDDTTKSAPAAYTHQEGVAASKTAFEVDLSNLAVTGMSGGQSTTIELGLAIDGNTSWLTGTSNHTLDGTNDDLTNVGGGTDNQWSATILHKNGEVTGEMIASELVKALGDKTTVQIDGVEYNVTADGANLKFEMTDDGFTTAAADVATNGSASTKFNGNFNIGIKQTGSGTLTGYTDNSTNEIHEGSVARATQLADVITCVYYAEKIQDGSGIKIGDTSYVFAGTDETLNAKYSDDVKVVDIRDLYDVDNNRIKYVDLGSGTHDGGVFGVRSALSRLTEVAADNDMWSVELSNNGNTLCLREKVTYSGDADLTTMKGINEQIQTFKQANSMVDTTKASGKALTLQIGDTSESFNQMGVNVEDMHAAAMGIGDIDISTQQGAADAVAKIKDAVNYVSNTRGTLGALQNRLDHTINNLGVMQENIQDAESTIRDVDVAKEMMAYTKNSILVQSAQAMLAQANQLPQGVLQLLG